MKKKTKTGKPQAKRPRPRAGTAHNTKRKLGAYGDTIKIADDFNDPLPEDILRAFEGDIEDEPLPKK
jgi:hypothetical protein